MAHILMGHIPAGCTRFSFFFQFYLTNRLDGPFIFSGIPAGNAWPSPIPLQIWNEDKSSTCTTTSISKSTLCGYDLAFRATSPNINFCDSGYYELSGNFDFSANSEEAAIFACANICNILASAGCVSFAIYIAGPSGFAADQSYQYICYPYAPSMVS